MILEQVKKLEPLDRLLYWIQERESIRLKKEAGEPKPWTNDPILQKFRFCNVRRMDDKVSQWLLTNWYKPHHGHPNMLLACALARHFNLPAALEAIGFPELWRPKRIKKVLRAMKAQGKRIFNGAYMVRGIGTTDKTEMVVDHVCQPLVAEPPKINTSSIQRSVEALLPYWGFSDFMAGQVIADLRWAVTGAWDDCKCWASMGPGSKRGLNRLNNKPINTPVKQEQFLEGLGCLINVCNQRLPKNITIRLEAIDYQNCLCEFGKYERTLFDGRRPKALYR